MDEYSYSVLLDEYRKCKSRRQALALELAIVKDSEKKAVNFLRSLDYEQCEWCQRWMPDIDIYDQYCERCREEREM